MSLFLKFGVLLMRTVAKPVSNTVKSTLKSHATFRALVVTGARLHARTNARWDRLVRRRPTMDKKGNPIVRRELTETEAIDLAADLLGEAFLLSRFPLCNANGRAVAGVGLWFQQGRSNKAEKEEKKMLLDKLKHMQDQLEMAGRQLVQSDRQHEELRKDLEGAISDLKLEIRKIHGHATHFKEHDLFSKEEAWEIIAEDDAKRGGRRKRPKLKGEWEELLDRLRLQQNNERERGMPHFI
jgi:optic atrophy 3 protein